MTRTTSAAALALLLSTSLDQTAQAAVDPVPSHYDPRMRHVDFNPMNPIRIVGSTFVSTQIIFAPGETITHVAIGDSDAWMPSPTGNLLFIKPVEVRAPTNMQVVTTLPDGSTRSYPFELIARPTFAASNAQVASLDGSVLASAAVTPFTVQITYPDDAREAALAARRKAALGADEKLAENRLDVDYFYGPRNWHYLAQGSTAIEPTEVSDNGRLTAMRFPGNSTMPVIYAVTPGSEPPKKCGDPSKGAETIVQYTMHADVAVVATTAYEFHLHYGDQVLNVYNCAFDRVGVNPGTGTTSPEIVRTIRKAGP